MLKKIIISLTMMVSLIGSLAFANEVELRIPGTKNYFRVNPSGYDHSIVEMSSNGGKKYISQGRLWTDSYRDGGSRRIKFDDGSILFIGARDKASHWTAAGEKTVELEIVNSNDPAAMAKKLRPF